MILLADFKSVFTLVEYTSLEDNWFLKLPECGIYFQSDHSGWVTAYRAYYQAVGEYFPASAETQKACFGIATIADAIARFGQPARDVPSIRIPGIAATSPGYEFLAEGVVVTVHYEVDSRLITHVHVNREKGADHLI
ncbi:hypothetical protein V9K90_25905 [Pseudomonas sp. CCNWLW56]|uniref:hypothetical protein n=1 Tax=unclassified Pseudomonas TaxID=196821 RepID=UPI003077FC4C